MIRSWSKKRVYSNFKLVCYIKIVVVETKAFTRWRKTISRKRCKELYCRIKMDKAYSASLGISLKLMKNIFASHILMNKVCLQWKCLYKHQQKLPCKSVFLLKQRASFLLIVILQFTVVSPELRTEVKSSCRYSFFNQQRKPSISSNRSWAFFQSKRFRRATKRLTPFSNAVCC